MGKTLETIQKQIEEAGGKYHLLDRKHGSPLLKDHFAFWHEDDTWLLFLVTEFKRKKIAVNVFFVSPHTRLKEQAYCFVMPVNFYTLDNLVQLLTASDLDAVEGDSRFGMVVNDVELMGRIISDAFFLTSIYYCGDTVRFTYEGVNMKAFFSRDKIVVQVLDDYRNVLESYSTYNCTRAGLIDLVNFACDTMENVSMKAVDSALLA